MKYDLPQINLTAPLKRKFALLLRATLLAGVFIIGLFSVRIIADIAEQKEKASWEGFLTQSAQQRSDEITHWLEQQTTVIQDIASNIALQIYMTELAAGKGVKEHITDEPAQAVYLQNLLNATARREGFEKGGLALLDKENHIIRSTGNIGNIDWVSYKPSEEKDGYITPRISPDSIQQEERFIAFIVPVYIVQGDNKPNQQIGHVVSIRDMTSLTPLLQKKPAKETSLELILVNQTKNDIELYKANMQNRQLDIKQFLPNRKDLAAISGIQTQNQMVLQKNTNADDVLAVATKIKESDWYLVQQVSYDEAMQSANTTRLLATALYSAVFSLLLTTAFFAMKAKDKLIYQNRSEHYKQNIEKLSYQKHRLESILNALPLAVHFSDSTDHHIYTNHKAASPENGISEAQTKTYHLELWKNRVKKDPITTLSYHGDNVIKSTHIPVESDEEKGISISGVLSIEENITSDFTGTYAIQQIVSMLRILADARVENIKIWKEKNADNGKTPGSNEGGEKLLWTD